MDKIHGGRQDSMLVHKQGDLTIKTKVPEKDNQELPKPYDTIALTQAMAGLGSNLEVGEKVSLKVGRETVAEVVKEGESNWDRFSTAASNFGKRAVMETKEMIDADPAFAFRESVEMVKDTLTQGAPETVATSAISGLYPGVRAGVLALDIYKAWKTLKDPTSSKTEKFLDVAHCITDVGGLVAAAAPMFGIAFPGMAALAAIAYASDIIVFGFHSLGYFATKIRKWREKKNDKAKKEEQNKPVENEKPDNVKSIQQVKEGKESGKGKKS
ncbi:MAG: hypothetical protein K8T10_07650 [Candidatus Eremiobacteraeota bacterium]|nr:hypothetical protein [Candidatus Eremiobacteraeota bacterium]